MSRLYYDSLRQWMADGMDLYVRQYRAGEFDANELAELAASGQCALCPEWIDRDVDETQLAELADAILNVVAAESKSRQIWD